jgi:excisionase family DNA binding protein
MPRRSVDAGTSRSWRFKNESKGVPNVEQVGSDVRGRGVPQLLPLLAVARALCVSPHTVRSWVRKGRLRPTRICRRLLFHPQEIERFLRQSQQL